jgi:hypothetical protein
MRTRREIRRKMHNGILYVLNSIAAIGFILSMLASGAEGRELVTVLLVFAVCGGWLGLVTWANVRLGNW